METKKFEFEGTIYTIPAPAEKDGIPFGIARKVRGYKTEEEATSEAFFLLLEYALTPEELDIWDALTLEKVQEVMTAFAEGEEGQDTLNSAVKK